MGSGSVLRRSRRLLELNANLVCRIECEAYASNLHALFAFTDAQNNLCGLGLSEWILQFRSTGCLLRTIYMKLRSEEACN